MSLLLQDSEVSSARGVACLALLPRSLFCLPLCSRPSCGRHLGRLLLCVGSLVTLMSGSVFFLSRISALTRWIMSWNDLLAILPLPSFLQNLVVELPVIMKIGSHCLRWGRKKVRPLSFARARILMECLARCDNVPRPLLHMFPL
jgi:hypothetical protein